MPAAGRSLRPPAAPVGPSGPTPRSGRPGWRTGSPGRAGSPARPAPRGAAVLDALGDHGQVQRVGQADDPGDQGQLLRVVHDVVDERSCRSSARRSGAAAGSSATSSRCRSRRSRSVRPISRSAARSAQICSSSRISRVSVISSISALGRHAGVVQRRPGPASTKPGVPELPDRDVDADVRRRARRRRAPPLRRPCAAPASSTQRPDRHDQPALLGHLDELVRRDHARAAGGASGPAPRSRPPRRWRRSTIGWYCSTNWPSLTAWSSAERSSRRSTIALCRCDW